MSWSIYREATHRIIDKDEIEDRMAWDDEGTIGIKQSTPEGCQGSQASQVAAAIEAAKVLAEWVGRPDDRVTVTLSGHANPGHAPCLGWGDEFIMITVYAVPRT